jgi:serine/threonine protein kinase/Tfp pilus assembly protein PilF
MSVTAAPVCHRCGAPLPEGEWAGTCPRCLIAAFAEEEKEGVEFVPGFVVQEEIAHGGMGIVYRAVQRHTGRVVALKMILPHLLDSPHVRARFQAEVESVAKLDHPNVLPIYEAGENRGVPYLVMKFVSGGTLAQRRAEFLGKARACARLVAAAARGVQHAHERGILHRDLKASNILLEQHGEPLVSDFGLAKWLDTTSDLTRTLTVFGTPGYIAPEQAKGSAANLTPAADVYSLGAILFDLLTGRPPFIGANALSVIQQAAATPAPKLRSFVPSLDRDLETVVARCLERDPKVRYQTAGALAEDLERWLDGRPIIARPVRAPARAFRWSRRNPILAGAVAASLLLALTVAWLLSEKFITPKTAALGKSIAVLPFENLSNDREDAFFADGVQDDLLTKLAKIADLKVISRTSVMQYRGEHNLREIGDALRVSHVLEGSVRKIGSWLHINAQLIDTRTDTHIWTEQYDRDLKDVFAIQSDIARKVAEKLHAKISPAEKLDIERPPTADLTAFELYTRANNLLLTATLSSTVGRDLLKAIDLLNRAVTQDPSFFQAYCLLAWCHGLLYFYGDDHTSARLALADAAVEVASRLRPDAGETHLARAQNLYRGYHDYEGALAELAVASKTLPNDPRLLEVRGYIQRRQGRWEESTRDMERALELDPRNVETLRQVALSYEYLRRYAEAEQTLDRALAIVPNDAATKAEHVMVELDWHADPRPLHQMIDSIQATDPAAIPQVADSWLKCALAERDVDAVKNALNAYGENKPTLTGENVPLTRLFVAGVTARMTKDDVRAQSAFTAARAEQEKTVQAEPNYGPAVCVLGLIDAGLGRKEAALREGRRAVELLPVEKDAISGPAMIRYLAVIAAWVGDNDLACEQLATASRLPNGGSYGQLKLLPFWDPLRGDPRFEKIVASLAPQGD